MTDTDGKIIGIVEYKDRPTFKKEEIDVIKENGYKRRLFISVYKIDTGRHYANLFGVSFRLVFRLAGVVYWVDAISNNFELGVGGRYDRKTTEDIEPVYYIKQEQLKEL